MYLEDIYILNDTVSVREYYTLMGSLIHTFKEEVTSRFTSRYGPEVTSSHGLYVPPLPAPHRSKVKRELII